MKRTPSVTAFSQQLGLAAFFAMVSICAFADMNGKIAEGFVIDAAGAFRRGQERLRAKKIEDERERENLEPVNLQQEILRAQLEQMRLKLDQQRAGNQQNQPQAVDR